MKEAADIGIIDYCAFATVLTISMGIGIYTSFIGNRSPEEFLMGNRSFGPISIAMSLLTSYVSAISLLGYTGETYAYGMQISFFLIGSVAGIALTAAISVPVIYPLKLTSINEYIGLRFRSLLLRRVISYIGCLQGLIYMGFCLYAPTLALSKLTPLSPIACIFLLGVIVTIYSSIGGIRAVVWTDVFQLLVMMAGLVVIIIVGLIDAGGAKHVFKTSLEGGRLDVFNFNPSIYERHNAYNITVLGCLWTLSFYGASQIYVQRLCAVSKFENAKKILYICAVGMIVIYFLIFTGGLIAYTAYADCDPLLLGLIRKMDEIFPYYTLDRLNFVVGLPGIFIATIIGGALSSLSSVMNALVAMLWQDFFLQFKYFSNVKPRTAAACNMILSFVIGGAVIGVAVIASTVKSLVQFSSLLLSSFMGGISGTFILAFLFPKTNMKGIWSGLFTSTVLVGVLSITCFMYATPQKHLPLSVENCDSDIRNSSYYLEYELRHSIDIKNESLLEDTNMRFSLSYLTEISYTLHSIFGVTICVVTALIVSFLTGNEDLRNVSPELVSPPVRRFYWGSNYIADEKKKLPSSGQEEHLVLHTKPLQTKPELQSQDLSSA